MWETTLTLVVSILSVGVMMGIVPYVMRRNIQFGVSMPEGAHQRPEIKRMMRTYLLLNIGLSLLALVPVLAGFFLGLSEEGLAAYIGWSVSLAVLANLLIAFMIYLAYYGKAKRLKAELFQHLSAPADTRVMVATDFREGLRTVSTPAFAFWGILIIALTAGLSALAFDGMPDYIPRQWGFDGEVSAYVPKTMGSVMLLPILQALMLPIFLVSNYVFKAGKQMIKPANPRVSLAQNRAFRQAMSRFLVGIGLGCLIFFAVLQYAIVTNLENVWVFNVATLVLTVLVMVFSIRLAVKYGQGGERYRVADTSGAPMAAPQEMVDDDEYWKWGFLYYNKADPAYFVEKRFGIGMTVNWARWQAWAFLGGLILFCVLMTVVPFFLLS